MVIGIEVWINMKNEEKQEFTCGTCGNRLHYHYEYDDINVNSRYTRCSSRPKMKQKNNSCPKWCPRRTKV